MRPCSAAGCAIAVVRVSGGSSERRDSKDDPVSLHLELADEALDQLAQRIAERLPVPGAQSSPWMNFDGLIEYTKIPEGTLRKLTASNQIPGHSTGRVKVYHRDEVDAALGYSPKPKSTPLRRVS